MAFRLMQQVQKKIKTISYNPNRFLTCSANHLQKDLVPGSTELDLRSDREKMIEKKFLELMAWYEKFTGLAEVRIYQDRVINAQDELLKIQEKRRVLNEELSRIVVKRNELQARFHTLSRDDPQWYSIIGQENTLLLDEKKLRNEMMNIERDERDYFTYMSNSVRDSHEKQRWQSDRTKYWSLVLTIISSFLTYLVSDWRHKRIVQQLVHTTSNNHQNTSSSNNNDTIQITQVEPVELKRVLEAIREGTVGLQAAGKINSTVHDQVKKLEAQISTCLKTEGDIKSNLIFLTKTLEHNHKEAIKLITATKQVQLIGNGDETLNDVEAIHGPSLGVGVLCTLGFLAIVRMFLSSG